MACGFEQTMGSKMLFLLRTAFWLTLVLVLIPLGSDQERTSGQSVDVDPVSAFLAAQATVSDIGGFCRRNPQACETGGDALTAIGSRARDGARIVYEYFDTQVADQAADDTLVTGSTASAGAGPSARGLIASAHNPVSDPETASRPVPRPKPRSDLNT